MHEMGIANAVIQAVRAEATLHPEARFLKVGLRVGELAGVDPDSLSFCFEALLRGTELEPLRLEIEPSPRRHLCPRCQRAFIVLDYETACPECGEAKTRCIAGDELELAYLEVEEPEEGET